MLDNYDIDYSRYADSDVFGTSVPSVYVNSIDISENDNSTTFKIMLCVFERSDPAGSFLWYKNDLVRGYLDIKVKLNEEDPFTTIDMVKQGDISEYEYETLSDGTVIYKIMYEAETTVNTAINDISDLSISAYVQIDVTSAYQDFGAGGLPGIGGNIAQVTQLLQGPTDTTTVFKNGTLIRTKKVWFTDPGNKLWLGLRHEHQGRTMAGPKHTNQSHPNLRSQRIESGVYYASSKEVIETIIDFSLDEQLANLLNVNQQRVRSSYSDLIKSESYVSDLYLTRAATSGDDRNDIITSYFTIDISSFIVQNSRYGYIYSYLSPSIKQELLQNSEIVNFLVYRHRSDIENEIPMLVIQSRDLPNRPSNFMNKQELREQTLSGNSPELRTFELNDPEILNMLAGEYFYDISVSIIDPIYDFFSDLYQRMRILLAQLEDFLELSSISYNYTFNILSKSVKQSIISLPEKSQPSALAQSLINDFFNTFNFPKASKSMLDSLSSNIYGYLSPQTATLESIAQTIEIFQALADNVQGFVNSKDYDSINESNVQGGTGVASNYLDLRHQFDTFDISDYKSYIKFLDISHSLNGLIVNANNLESLYDNDISAYVSNPSALGTTATTSRLSFFSAKNINLNGSVYTTSAWTRDVFSELQALNFFGQSDTMRSLESGYTGLEAAEILTQYGITVEIPGVTDEVVLNVQMNLGLGSSAGASTEFDLDALSSLHIDEQLALIYKNLSTRWPVDDSEVSFSYFEPDAPGSGTNSVQSKSLMYALGLAGLGTPSDFNRSSLAAEVSNDPQTNLNSQRSKFLIYFKYGTMGKVEYLSPNSEGVSNPEWIQLTARSNILNLPAGTNFLCRTSRIVSYGYPRRSTDVFDLSIKNQYFILQISG